MGGYTVIAAQDVQVALIGMVGMVLVALIGLWVATASHGKTIKKVEYGINHVDEQPSDGGPMTLGQLVRQIDSKVESNGLANADAHGRFGERLDQQDRLVQKAVDGVAHVNAVLVPHIASDESAQAEIRALGERNAEIAEALSTRTAEIAAEVAEVLRIKEAEVAERLRVAAEAVAADLGNPEHPAAAAAAAAATPSPTPNSDVP